MHTLLPSILLVLLLPCFLIPIVGKHCSERSGWLLSLPAFASCSLLLMAAPSVLAGEVLGFSTQWVPFLGVDFSLQLSGIRLALALLVTGIGGCIQLYTFGYMHDKKSGAHLSLLLYLFMFAMTGICLADHLIIFFIFWEVTSILSYLLIGFNHTDKVSRRNALQALLITGLGGISLLLGFILIARVSGVWHLSQLSAQHSHLTESPYYPAILCLVLLGAFTKSAQFPFHFWLPNAMAAPTPVSAYLHSATMVKAGVFLLFLMTPIIGMTQAWSTALLICGGITFFLGAAYGFVQSDLKKILAGSTLAILGMLTYLIGIGSTTSLLAALIILFAHAFYKASLFMVAGCVDHATGTRDIEQLGGLRQRMPLLATIAAIAGLSMIGIPPLLGFIGKEYALKAAYRSTAAPLHLLTIVVSSVLVVTLALKASYQPFFGNLSSPQLKLHQLSNYMLVGPLALSCIGLLTGIFPLSLSHLITTSTDQLASAPTHDVIHLWGGFNLPLLLSSLIVGAGFLTFKYRGEARPILQRLNPQIFDQLYDVSLKVILKSASVLTSTLQTGFLRHYIIVIILTTFVLIAQKLILFGTSEISISPLPWNLPVLTLTLLMLGAMLVATISRSRLTTLIALGLIGYGVAFIFMTYSAPDLAITQILVETLTVVLFASVVHKLPNHRPHSSKKSKVYDTILSAAFGCMITLLVLKSNSLHMGQSISNSISSLAYPEGKGSNIVNVILVDFRALDTWGEICVLAIASLGATSILSTKLHTKKR